MDIKKYVGKTIDDLASNRNVFNKPVRVFVLDGDSDDVGKPLTPEFIISHFLYKHPFLKGMVVKSAEDYYGETILRVGISQESVG